MINGLGKRLQEQRFARNLSQKEVANAINVSSSIISNYESGERTPSIENLMSLADFYSCSTDYLLGLDKSVPINNIDTSMLTPEQNRLLQLLIPPELHLIY